MLPILIKKYNNLDGKTVTRDFLIKLVKESDKIEHNIAKKINYKLNTLLLNSSKDSFYIEIKNKLYLPKKKKKKTVKKKSAKTTPQFGLKSPEIKKEKEIQISIPRFNVIQLEEKKQITQETQPTINTTIVVKENKTVDDDVKPPMTPVQKAVISKAAPIINRTVVDDKPKGLNASLNTSKRSLEDRYKVNSKVHESYVIPDKDIAEFLGDVEIKEKESVVITLAGEQGSGKTRNLFQLMNTFGQNYRVGHASMEEHPESKLYKNKEDQYIDDKAWLNISNPEIKTLDDLHKLIINNDVIFIDSFAKLRRIDKSIDLDQDLRKKYNGKLFVIIYQLTVDGKMRGGSESQFDGDIILFVDKHEDYRYSYVYANKNRYQDKPLNELKFNIYQGKLNPKQEETTVSEEQVREIDLF